MADKTQNQDKPQGDAPPAASTDTKALELQLKTVLEQNQSILQENKALQNRLNSMEAELGEVSNIARSAGSQPSKRKIDIIRVDRAGLTPEQVELIHTYEITWLGPKADDYVQPVKVETIGTQNKAVARWREAMGFSPEGLQGVKATLVDNVPLKDDKTDGKPATGGTS